ncbi:MAG TPA: hypothetical protein VFH51_11630 [Myxococcota bacterium]|nr:hypothetical protein [Myxococcota bacterium]
MLNPGEGGFVDGESEKEGCQKEGKEVDQAEARREKSEQKNFGGRRWRPQVTWTARTA